MEEIYDIYAVRVIVDSLNDCYNVLGMIHDMYRPIPNRFKDYISTPKPNLYQSLHTTVLGKEGVPFEVQIRTWEMHHTAEYGIAAHWKYKLGLTKSDSFEQRLMWVRQMLENQQDTVDSTELVRTIKTDLAPEEVFVFTPKGDVISLPIGSTVIDFAYAIHSAVGNRMIGAKVDGRIVPIDYKVKTGEIIDVLTTKEESHGPSRDWLKIVKTSEARNKIRQWFKKEKREENIIEGKAEIEREFRRNGIELPEPEMKAFLEEIATHQHCQTVEDLYAALGYGGIQLWRLMPRIRDNYNKIKKPVEESQEVRYQKAPSKATGGVIIDGIDNCLIKFSKCCNPLPGDDIIGFVTRGYGISIHRRDCVNVHIEEEPDRWVRAWWVEDMAANAGHVNKFSTGLQISTRNRIGVLSDVTLAFASSKINVHEISARDLNDGYGVINAMVDVTSVHQLDNMISRLRSIKGVVDVTRTVDTN